MLPAPFHLLPDSETRHHQLNVGKILFYQNDKTRGLFFVTKGEIELQRFTQEGQRVVIHRAKKGELFAEASLFSPQYHCDAVTVVPTTLIELDRRAVLAKFQRDPEFALAVAKRFAHQNQNYRRKLELLAIKSAQERIYTAVVEGFLTGSIRVFASEICLSHEVVYRGLAELVKKGVLVKTGRGKYQITTAAKRLSLNGSDN